MVHEKTPLQYKFELSLWKLAIIRELIKCTFDVSSLSEVSVGRLIRRLGFTMQRPLYRACQQDPTLVKDWRDQYTRRSPHAPSAMEL